MQHPTIVSANANERFNQMVQAAEAHRQAKRVLRNHQTFWSVFVQKFQLGFHQNHAEEPSLVEAIR